MPCGPAVLAIPQPARLPCAKRLLHQCPSRSSWRPRRPHPRPGGRHWDPRRPHGQEGHCPAVLRQRNGVSGVLYLGPGCSPAQWTGSDGDNSVGGDNSTPGAFPDCPRHQECGWLQGYVQCSLSSRQDQGPSGSGPARPQLLGASLCQSGGRDQRPPGPGLSDTDPDSATGSLIAAQGTSPRGSGVAQDRTFPKAPFSEQNSGTGGESLCVITIAGRVPLLGPGAVIWAPVRAPGLAQRVRGSPGSSVTMYGLVCSV